jgi:hypothetical protein
MARIYAGVHYRNSTQIASAMGQLVAKKYLGAD